MIGAAACFWNKPTNNFHLSCGMVGPTLLDVAVITGLPTNFPEVTCDMHPDRTYKIAQKNFYSDFISHHMGHGDDPVTDEESVAFLYYWLNAIVFYSRSIQMQKLFLPLAALLHEGYKFNLAKLILGNLYDELGHLVDGLRNNSSVSVGGPLWLLQLYLNVVFEKYMKQDGSNASEK
ncbi:uncharacterized protein DS421_19g640370 [Arachis hypogaea]|uniref:Aminotransferase-like plant mobile domain-containing protein n=1 Tax=Arachis hypogaea TaxID=3818 RepID=A0A6B9V3M9_ARAHY|nr:uncharacterized protein DS421_19g640370 [Arachis hypogaea]